MTTKLDIYKCSLCGNIVEVLHAGVGVLVCCGQEMAHLRENSTDAAGEKHVPVIEKTIEGYKVSVGSIPHPMQDDHYIEWVELIADEKAYREFLKPNQNPEVIFNIEADSVKAREYCNLHGLWATK